MILALTDDVMSFTSDDRLICGETQSHVNSASKSDHIDVDLLEVQSFCRHVDNVHQTIFHNKGIQFYR